MDKFYTYIYRDPTRNNENFYVGKGFGGRAKRHLIRNDKHPLTHRIKYLLSTGVTPVIDFLIKNVDEEFALLVEEEAISLYGRKDLGKGTLLNLTNGGEGESGAVCSTIHRLKLSVAHKGKKFEKISKALTGKKKGPHSEEHKSKISNACKGRKLSRQHILKRDLSRQTSIAVKRGLASYLNKEGKPNEAE